ncbi:MAG: hypothetical protein AB7F64_09215 [Gammaproteobacteria bacterium]
MVECQICKQLLLRINDLHLKKHKITTAEYRTLFPLAAITDITVCEKTRNSLQNKSDTDKNQIIKKRQRSKQLKKDLGWVDPRKGKKSTLSFEERKARWKNEKYKTRNEQRKQERLYRICEYLKENNLLFIAANDEEKSYTVQCNSCSNIFSRTRTVFAPFRAKHYKGRFCPICFPPIISCYSEEFFEKFSEKKTLPAKFYVLKMVDKNNEFFIKIGITKNNITERYRGENFRIVEVLGEWDMALYQAFKLEHNILCSNLRRYFPKEKFGGFTECFYIDQLEQINTFIKNAKSDSLG